MIEFGLGEDGAIKRVEPIYAKGRREVALAYARAVQGWSWTTDAAKAIPRASDDAQAHLVAVADARDLPDRHPLRVGALLRLANLAAKRGELAAANGYFQRTGLTEQQCALIGPKPAMQKTGATSSLYPQEAVRMGFEGWAVVEYDITPDGKTASQRTLFAYPPFVFGDAAKAMIANARFDASYRPAGGTACSASQTPIRFTLSP